MWLKWVSILLRSKVVISDTLKLNLTAANHVFLTEPQWNPMIEDQALDGVYRIGQKKEITTTLYVVDNTLEESIHAQQSEKRIWLSWHSHLPDGRATGLP